MITTKTIEDAIYTWAHAVLGDGVEIIWQHDDGPRPTASYVMLHYKSDDQVGSDVELFPDDESNTTIIGNRDIVLYIQGFGHQSKDFLESLRMSPDKTSGQEILRRNGLSFRGKTNINDISALVDNHWEERQQTDMFFGYSQEHAEPIGTIDTMDLEKGFYYNNDLEIITEDVTYTKE